MRYHLQVVGAPSADGGGPLAVVLHFDSQRYLFNCGEGCQRLFADRRVRLAAPASPRERAMFFTRARWHRCLGGLPGLLLTVADAAAAT
ncbi:Zinc phosphodiesterase ELAC protein 2, partial [Cladochytrium tenue]